MAIRDRFFQGAKFGTKKTKAWIWNQYLDSRTCKTFASVG
jgi:hypothetical protein